MNYFLLINSSLHSLLPEIFYIYLFIFNSGGFAKAFHGQQAPWETTVSVWAVQHTKYLA